MHEDMKELAACIIVASILLSAFLEAVFQIDQNTAGTTQESKELT